jgi:hypothetical protein
VNEYPEADAPGRKNMNFFDRLFCKINHKAGGSAPAFLGRHFVL